MKITRLILGNYQQFKHLDIDLTYPKGHPKEGQPLDKICFIGKNGTGKSTLLKFVLASLQNKQDDFYYIKKNLLGRESTNTYGGILAQDVNTIYIENSEAKTQTTDSVYRGKIDSFYQYLDLPISNDTLSSILYEDDIAKQDDQLSELYEQERNNQKITINNYFNIQLLVYSPSESKSNNSIDKDFSEFANRNDSSNLFTKKRPYHEISYDYLKDFWASIIYRELDRAKKYQEFQEEPENQNKTLKEVREVFDKLNPNYLAVLAELWSIILESSGLHFDYNSAIFPAQLNERLHAFVKTKSKNISISSNQLSTGIRHLLFRLGYLKSLYHNEDINSAFVIIDEPENSLFPDILLRLADIYTNKEDFPNTQFFFATHSPIFAAQFDPAERIILDFDDDYNVTWGRGTSAEGDDPNDLLTQDFLLENVMGKTGVKMWERYIELRKQINSTTDIEEKERLINEWMEIGNMYHF